MKKNSRKISLSIVIVTRNRKQNLEECLRSIKHQSILPEEVIVVENSAIHSLQALINQFQKKLNILYVNEIKIGIPFARNTGLKLSNSDITAFIDDDCVLDVQWVRTVKGEFERNTQLCVLVGKNENYFENRVLAKAEQTIYENWLRTYGIGDETISLQSGIFIDTKNLALRTKTLHKYHLTFDTSASFKGEDTDFGIRLQKKLSRNESMSFSPKMIVKHKNNIRLRGFIYKRLLEGREKYFLSKKYGQFEPKLVANNIDKLKLERTLAFKFISFFSRQFNRLGFYWGFVSKD